MEPLILHPTSTAQWQALVHEAEQARSTDLGEELQSYLVFLLMRFVSRADLASSVLAMEFLESCHESGQKRCDMLHELGDKCLLFSGLFPERAEHRRVRVSYFVALGQNAYGCLSDLQQTTISRLYSNLAEGFIKLMEVLQTIRSLGCEQGLSPLLAAELWQDTGSQYGLEALKQHTDATLMAKNASHKLH